jgi:CARDB
VTVTNVGTAPAGPFVLLVTVPGGTFTIGGLAAGASTTRTWSVCPTPTITATADSSGQVAEANEANDSASTSC